MLSVVPKVVVNNILFARKLVCTVVGANIFSGEINFANQGDLTANSQEHPTRHFYAAVGNTDVPPVCCVSVDEM